MRRTYFLVLLIGCMQLGSGGSVRAQSSPGNRPIVVELYTSQGCSSCPPADALLGELARMPRVMALAFHVDYWNGIGWRDRFSSPQATQRQERYVETLGLSSAFTPQVVVDGRTSFVGSDRRRILAAMAERLNTIPISVEVAEGELSVTLPEWPDRGTYDVNLAAYLPEASTRIEGGENSGRSLHEFNIVRQFRSLGVWRGDRTVLHTRLDSFPADATQVAVLLQATRQGPIAGSAVAALS
jgi:hypothetical protein